MSKPLSYSFLTYEEYKADVASMSGNDLTLFEAFAYPHGTYNELNSTEQMIASLCNVIVDGPSGIDQYPKGWLATANTYETLAKVKNVTGMAHNLSYK
jgi:hypothetical protein